MGTVKYHQLESSQVYPEKFGVRDMDMREEPDHYCRYCKEWHFWNEMIPGKSICEECDIDLFEEENR